MFNILFNFNRYKIDLLFQIWSILKIHTNLNLNLGTYFMYICVSKLHIHMSYFILVYPYIAIYMHACHSRRLTCILSKWKSCYSLSAHFSDKSNSIWKLFLAHHTQAFNMCCWLKHSFSLPFLEQWLLLMCDLRSLNIKKHILYDKYIWTISILKDS